MLNYFRHHPLRKSLWLIVLLSSLLVQSQNLFACKIMDDGVKTTCCCEEADSHCPLEDGSIEDSILSSENASCCDVSVQVNIGLQNTVAADVHHNKQILSLDAPQPPPTIIIEYQVFVPLKNITRNSPNKNIQYSTAFSGTSTYFKTRRLRI